LGQVTRLLRFVSDLPKSYTGEIVLGVATSTLDASGEVTGRWDMSGVTLEAARAAAGRLTGTIAQVPPMVSALHVGGRRLHQLARAGFEVDRPARMVTVSRFSLDPALGPGRSPVFTIRVDCSSGTYVRSLAADLGTALGGGSHLRHLRRVAVGSFVVTDAVPLERISVEDVRPPRAALSGMAAIQVDDRLVAVVGHGRVLGRTELGVEGDGPWAVIDGAGDLLAVYEARGDGRVKPAVVLTSASGPDQ
jgi:tRNA pseudouridine55 synthase